MISVLHEKFIQNNLVGVLYSPGHGSGWSTWNQRYKNELIFDPGIVTILESETWTKQQKIERMISYCNLRYPNVHLGGIDNLCVMWLPTGTEFLITEQDGAEDVLIKNSVPWIVA